MDHNLSTKVGDKWKTFGKIKTNQYGKNQASFRVKDLEELIILAKEQGKEWVNLSVFDNVPKPEPKQQSLAGYKGQDVVLDDLIPWT